MIRLAVESDSEAIAKIYSPTGVGPVALFTLRCSRCSCCRVTAMPTPALRCLIRQAKGSTSRFILISGRYKNAENAEFFGGTARAVTLSLAKVC